MENTTTPFKVDLRVICTINRDRYDVGFAEFAKNFTAPKAQKSHVKLILVLLLSTVNARPTRETLGLMSITTAHSLVEILNN